MQQFALNNPLSTVDAYGLFNVVKTAVCFGNVGYGSYQAARGAGLVTAGGVTVKFGLGIPAVLVGAKDLVGAFLKIRRGAKQCTEAVKDPSIGHCKNLLGLLPFGTEFDDPDETLKDAWDRIQKKKWYERLAEALTWF